MSKTQIENFEDAKSLVRKYLLGTRSRHAKIISIQIEEKTEPNAKNEWTMTGSYTTETGDEKFVASVTSRGEVILKEKPPPQTPPEPKPKPSKKKSKRR
ncbi:MAG TPA: hypothetical protein VK503_04410 [Candidatus Bathyarchaeia archaeon]|nr:hypothetical protein [Candidatus Bathyarchaeia archaeon]